MPKIDFSQIDDVQDFSPLPDGKYLCKLKEVEESETQNRDEMWKLRFEVVEGKYTGRIIFDNMVFSEAALKRVKLICSRLGLAVSGEVDLSPSALKGRRCHVSVLTEEYEDDENNIKKRNIVPFAGYEKAGDSGGSSERETEEDESEENLPF